MEKELFKKVSIVIEELINEEVNIIPYETITGLNCIIPIDNVNTLYVKPNKEKIYSIISDNIQLDFSSIKEIVHYINENIL